MGMGVGAGFNRIMPDLTPQSLSLAPPTPSPEPGLVGVDPGSGVIIWAPVSVCHQVSTTAASPLPTICAPGSPAGRQTATWMIGLRHPCLSAGSPSPLRIPWQKAAASASSGSVQGGCRAAEPPCTYVVVPAPGLCSMAGSKHAGTQRTEHEHEGAAGPAAVDGRLAGYRTARLAV